MATNMHRISARLPRSLALVPTFQMIEQQRQKRKTCDEKATDETLCGQKCFKVGTFVAALDKVWKQFGQQNVLFTHRSSSNE
jgi:hypothetical protein